jgi:alkanesulfonate monooxygenase SsuD/methylene tetrahydromethanopterin reductase-like flavin-dependent oxidoreductase (luciferase family)
MSRVPLSVLDLIPISSGSNPREALRNTIDLARRAEQFGYHRYWFAEHHLNPGVAGASPAVAIALAAAATSRIRLGSGGVQLGHRTALSTDEEFGLLDAAHPGRIDLGLGRSPGKLPPSTQASTNPATHGAPPASVSADAAYRTIDGLLIPPAFSVEKLAGLPGLAERLRLNHELLNLPGAESADYGEQIDDILALLHGQYRAPNGQEAHATPGEGADVQVWILGSSAGQSASVAGKLGLRFAANYHVSPGTILEAVDAYRAAFQPSTDLPQPYVTVSADVVVAPNDTTATELAQGYGAWVRSIRTGEGAIKFPTPQQAAERQWTEADLALVADRTATQFTGSPATVADKLDTLQRVTGADELHITTITHDHADRVRSYELLAREWDRR